MSASERYGLLPAGIDASPQWHQDRFAHIGDHVWHVGPPDIQDWAFRLTNLDGTAMAAAFRGRAVSAVRTFCTHCAEGLGAAHWHLPPRRALAGPTPPAVRETLTRSAAADALRTVADHYRGPHAERARLAVYMTLVGLRPGQSIAVVPGPEKSLRRQVEPGVHPIRPSGFRPVYQEQRKA